MATNVPLLQCDLLNWTAELMRVNKNFKTLHRQRIKMK